MTVVAHAQEAACLSPMTRFDVCQHAREMQEGFAPSLPMQLNSNMALERVAAIGPRVVFYTTWSTSSTDLEAALRNAKTNEDAIKDRMVSADRDLGLRAGYHGSFHPAQW
jgi:hypothetical protein